MSRWGRCSARGRSARARVPDRPREVLGVFALPRVVLFPGATLPLHVFEPRYRALVRDALAGDSVFALALLKPGFESTYEGAPEIHPIGCAGRIAEALPLPDGRFLLNLTGVQRVEFQEMTRGEPYRSHRVRYLPELAPDESAPASRQVLLRLLAAYQQIVSALSGRGGPGPILTVLPFAETVNRIAFGLDIDPAAKYRLLENGDLLARAERIAALLESALPDYLDLDHESIN